MRPLSVRILLKLHRFFFYSYFLIFCLTISTHDFWFSHPIMGQITLDDIPLDAPHSQIEIKTLPETIIEQKLTYITELPSHAPIIITSNDDFTDNGDWTGSGASGDPYLFNGYFINTSGPSGISISNTDVYFRIENIWVNGSLDPGVGAFHLENVINGLLINNTATQSDYGFHLSNSDNNTLINNTATQSSDGFFLISANNNTLTNNTASDNTGDGFCLSSSSNYNNLTYNTVTQCSNGFYLIGSHINVLINNTATQSDNGFFLSGSDTNMLINNRAFSNSPHGFYLLVSSSNILTQNFASDNGNSGFFLAGSDTNEFTNNTASLNSYGFYFWINSDNNILSKNIVSDNINYGIILKWSDNTNFVEKNQFISNNGTGIQGYDNGTDNVFQFNYWNDWTNPDLDDDLIVDIPYPLEGIANTMDNYPLVSFVDVQFITLIGLSNNAYLLPGTIIAVNITLPYILEHVDYNWNGDSNTSISLGSTTNYSFDTTLPSTGSQHFLTVYANDSLGTWHSRQSTFFIDDETPLITNNGANNGTYQRPGTLINLSVIDDLAGISQVWYIWDNNGTVYSLSAPYNIALIPLEGWHSLQIYANDTLGNQADFFLLFNIDATPPAIGLNSPSNGSISQSGITIDIILTDSNNTLIYHWNSDLNQTVPDSFDPILPTGEGTHELYLYASDLVGNWVFKKYVFISDNIGPEIFLTSPEYNAILPSRSLINLTISDHNAIARVLFNWDSTDNVSLEAPYDVFLATGSGEHTLRVYAQDEASNWTKATFVFTTSDSLFDPTLLIIGLLCLILVLLGAFLYLRSPKRWHHKVEHVLVLSQSGLPLYSQALQDRELGADVVLAGGALIGISSLSHEITQASHVKVIKQENYCIMLEQGKNVILAVMITEEVKSIRSRMIDFIADFELTFEEIIKTQISDTEVFEPAKELVEKYFII